MFYFTVKCFGNYFVKSAVRISQLISQTNVWGINCEIQGVSMVSQRNMLHKCDSQLGRSVCSGTQKAHSCEHAFPNVLFLDAKTVKDT